MMSIWAISSLKENHSFVYWVTTIWGEIYPFTIFSRRKTKGYFGTKLGYARITTRGWVPILPQHPRVVYSMQQCVPMSNVPTTLAIMMMSQVQVFLVVFQP